MDRVQKIISNLGYCSRRKAEELITLGKVKINGETVSLGDKANADDKIEIEGKTLRNSDDKFFYILNKPKGVLVTKNDPKGRKTVYDLDSMINLRSKLGFDLNYVGRLDGMSEGLLVFTNDGELNNKLTHPSKHVSKTYLIRTEPEISDNDVKKLSQGILIDERKFFAQISSRKNNEFLIKISEGRNRIIRRAMDKLGYKIFKLKRVSVSKLKLGKLRVGEIRELTKGEIDSLL